MSHKHHLCGAFQYSPGATSPNPKTHLDDLCKLHGLGHRSTRLRILLCKTHSNNSLESELYCPLNQIKTQYNALLIQEQSSLQVHPDQLWGVLEALTLLDNQRHASLMISLLEELASKPGSATAPSPSADKRNELRFWTSRNGHQIQATLIDCKPTILLHQTLLEERHDDKPATESERTRLEKEKQKA